MSSLDIDKWPIAYQIAAGLGAAAVGAFFYLRGIWNAKKDTSSDELRDLRLTQALEDIVNALRIALDEKISSEINRLENRVRGCEIDIARLEK